MTEQNLSEFWCVQSRNDGLWCDLGIDLVIKISYSMILGLLKTYVNHITMSEVKGCLGCTLNQYDVSGDVIVFSRYYS